MIEKVLKVVGYWLRRFYDEKFKKSFLKRMYNINNINKMHINLYKNINFFTIF